MDIDKSLAKIEDPGVAFVFDNYAGVLYAKKQYREAVALLQRAVEIDGQLLGPDSPDTKRISEHLVAAFVAAAGQGNP